MKYGFRIRKPYTLAKYQPTQHTQDNKKLLNL